MPLTTQANRVLARTTGLKVKKVGAAKKRERIPPPRHPVGTAVVSRFFDPYPEFFSILKSKPPHDRLNFRYEAIFAQNRDIRRWRRWRRWRWRRRWRWPRWRRRSCT